MKKQIVLVGMIALLASGSLFAEGAQETGEQKKEFATVVKLTGIPWFNRMEEGVRQADAQLGVEAYQVGPSEADEAQQVKMVEDLVTTRVDALCVVPNDAKSLEPVFKKAKEQGIIVITHESPNQRGHDFDVEMIDNVKFGQYHIDKMVEYMGEEGEYVIYVGSLTVPAHNLWTDAAILYAEERYPKLKLVTERVPCSEDAALARQKTLELLKAYPNLKGIIGFGSLGPIGAAQAIAEKGLKDQVAVLGTVLPGHASQYLKDGSLKHGTLWDPAQAGFAMNYIAQMLLKGTIPEVGMEVPGVGEISAINGKTIILDAPIKITAENADSFGF